MTGRFVNADGLINGNQDMIGYNLFAYCSNNPVMHYDPTGACKSMWDQGIAGPCPGPWHPSCSDYKDPFAIPAPATNKPSNGLDAFKNNDGSYSLYDNHRKNPDSVFHEQILSAKVSAPSLNPIKGDMGLGSIKVSLITGGWEWKYADLSLFDFGTASLSLLRVHSTTREPA